MARHSAADTWLAAVLVGLGLASTFQVPSPVKVLGRWLGADPALVLPAPSGLVLPVAGVAPGTLRDTYGDDRSNRRRHEALDIMAPRGTPVLATAAGSVVEITRYHPLGGLAVYQSDLSGRWCYYYAHLDSLAYGVSVGSMLSPGQRLGAVGSSGNAPRAAPHLHFAVMKRVPAGGSSGSCWGAEPVNPYPLLGGD
jgi:murein DD-endopeptidase MepM/ murein hydrolase activator NlpD